STRIMRATVYLHFPPAAALAGMRGNAPEGPMNRPSDLNTDTTDLGQVSIEEQTRRRFAAALEKSRQGGPTPDAAEYLDSVPESARSWLREELQLLERACPSQEPTIVEGRDYETRPD